MRFTKKLNIQGVQTELFPLGGDLQAFIVQSLSTFSVKENTVLAIASKLFSLAEGRVVKTKDKKQLVLQEADQYLGENDYGFHLTIKEGLLLPSAGIDQSNSPTGDYLLFPKNPYQSLQKLWLYLKAKWSLKNLGLIMTDSHTTPLRKGVTGVGIAHFGFQAVLDQRGEKDLYGRELKVTTINNVDALASSAVWTMGEGKDRCPLALIEGAILTWQDHSSSEDIRISSKEDLYRPLFKK